MSMVQPLKANEFEEKVLKAGNPVIVDFWAEWCGPCAPLGEALDELAPQYSEKASIYRMNVEGEGEEQLVENFNIQALPVLMVINNGNEVARMTGCKPKEEIVSFLKEHFA